MQAILETIEILNEHYLPGQHDKVSLLWPEQFSPPLEGVGESQVRVRWLSKGSSAPQEVGH